MANVNTDLVTNFVAVPQVLNSAQQLHGVKRVAAGTIALAAGDLSATDTVMLAPIPSNASITSIKLFNDDLDSGTTNTAVVGTTRWNDSIGSSETTLKGGTVILKNGVDLVARVVNKVFPNATLTKAAYQAVRVSGAQGQRLAVAYAQADGDPNSADTIGLVTETIPTNQEGFIITVGQLENINTTGSLQGETWTDGDVLYLSPTTPGAITNIKPSAPQHLVVMGYVEYAHVNNGKIYVKVMNGWELGELHDVNTTGVVAGQVLKYNGTIWTPSSDAGITGSGVTGQVAYWNGTNSQTGSATLTYTPTTSLLVNNSVTAASSIARGTNLTPTLVAAANNDVLVGLDINPTFTNGAFTGVSNHAIRVPSFNTTSSQIRIGSLELQSYSLNNSWFSDNMFFNGTGFQYRNTGKATLFYFFGGEGQFRSYASASAGTVVSTFNSCKLKFDELGNFAVGSSIGEANGLFTNAFLRVFSTGNVTINQPTTDAGYRLDVNGTARVSGNLRFDEQLRDNRDNGVILQSLSSVVTNRILTIGNATYLNINFPNGNILVGTTTNVASSKVTIDSTTQGFLPPRMTTTQKNAIGTPAAGLMVFDTTLVKLCVYNGTTWETITSI